MNAAPRTSIASSGAVLASAEVPEPFAPGRLTGGLGARVPIAIDHLTGVTRRSEMRRTRSYAAGISGARRTASFWIFGGLYGVFVAAAAAPSPLYGVYAARYHFTTLVLTIVFAVYAIGLLAALLVTGRLSDHVGRRPVILGAIALHRLDGAVRRGSQTGVLLRFGRRRGLARAWADFRPIQDIGGSYASRLW